MSEHDQHEIKATLEVLSPYVADLRRRGYDASLWVERRDDHFTVEIRVRIPPAGIPIEAT